MPVVITFDIAGATSTHHNQIQSLFERFGWENVGGTSYRYPPLGLPEPTEDWFNCVVPALMLFRAYSLKHSAIKKFSLDVQSSTGYNPVTLTGTLPCKAKDIGLSDIGIGTFGKKNLIQWIDDIEYPY